MHLSETASPSHQSGSSPSTYISTLSEHPGVPAKHLTGTNTAHFPDYLTSTLPAVPSHSQFSGMQTVGVERISSYLNTKCPRLIYLLISQTTKPRGQRPHFKTKQAIFDAGCAMSSHFQEGKQENYVCSTPQAAHTPTEPNANSIHCQVSYCP